MRKGSKMTQAQRMRVSMGMKGNKNQGNMSGEENPNSVLTEKNVFDIRHSSASSKYLSQVYGVSQCHVNDIKKRRFWKHLS